MGVEDIEFSGSNNHLAGGRARSIHVSIIFFNSVAYLGASLVHFRRKAWGVGGISSLRLAALVAFWGHDLKSLLEELTSQHDGFTFRHEYEHERWA